MYVPPKELSSFTNIAYVYTTGIHPFLHICVGKLTIIASDNGLSPGRHQAIIWTNAGILLIGPLGTDFGEILIRIQIFSFKKLPLKMSSAKWCPFCLGLNELKQQWYIGILLEWILEEFSCLLTTITCLRKILFLLFLWQLLQNFV